MKTANLPIEIYRIITSLFGALSIWRYPNFDAIPYSSIVSRAYLERFCPVCSPSTSFKQSESSSNSPCWLTKWAIIPINARSLPDVQRSIVRWIQDLADWRRDLILTFWKSYWRIIQVLIVWWSSGSHVSISGFRYARRFRKEEHSTRRNGRLQDVIKLTVRTSNWSALIVIPIESPPTRRRFWGLAAPDTRASC